MNGKRANPAKNGGIGRAGTPAAPCRDGRHRVYQKVAPGARQKVALGARQKVAPGARFKIRPGGRGSKSHLGRIARRPTREAICFYI